ncbi:hypothetical protein TPY_0207 [Sulfobacillus acidophilus TPY]|uniref:Sporulation protein YabP n=1 Tax=Sulfobacillus acidophilus (strain ATCC 700253 / DSM 10332 / NAL) TaxID=679936 RepID=G8TWB5_SULAD|nr:hypothetical protein TPY_0207 [Sulfobacillus acidophilus TPY]AEW03758.1 sporulation protein YabP [Sulfobacillus acidophilus DSM 10332]MCY0864908.1 sporulation protein YabP [Sulfobacillus sp.]
MEEKREHAVSLVNRQTLTLQGVEHVDNFDDDTIVLNTTLGSLTIRGHNLRIQTLDLETGLFVAVGEFESIVYGKKRPPSGDSSNAWKKIWR